MPPRSDWFMPSGILLLAFLLRVWNPAAMQIEHFDEGVYASDLFAGHLDHQYPDQHLYAPPLLPRMLEWTLILGGGRPHAALWLNAVLGTLLVAAVYWGAREWFDESTAFVAGVLAATSDFAILFGRAALTDIPLCLWLTLSLVTGARALRSGGWLWIGCSICCGALAWWTKYNGWLAPAILGAGLCGWWLFERKTWPEVRAPLIRWLLISGGIGLLWLPFLWQLESLGGYRAVAENHRGYFVGLAGWITSAQRQFMAQQHILGTSTFAGLLIAWTTLTWTSSTPSAGSVRRMLSNVVVLSLLFLSTAAGLWTLALAGTAILAWQRCQSAVNSAGPVAEGSVDSRLSGWILAAWVISLLIAVPLYRPYPRLQLPLQTGLCFVVARSLVLLVQSMRPAQYRWIAAALSCLGLLIHGPSAVPWQPRRGLQQTAAQFRADLTQRLTELPRSLVPEFDCIIYVLAEPGIYYHLAAAEGQSPRYIAMPAATLSFVESAKLDRRLPTFLVTGLHAHRQYPELLEGTSHENLSLLAEHSYSASDLVLLDDVSPKELDGQRQQIVRLWQINH